MATIAELQAKADALIAKVQAETSIENSLITLLAEMVANNRKLAEDLSAAIAASDPVAMQAVADQLDQDAGLLDVNINTLTEALKANTPAA